MTSAELIVSEIFGPTWQGEGPSAGQLAAFVRLGRCNLDCGTSGAAFACDTPYTWNARRHDLHAELRRMGQHEVWRELKGILGGCDAELVVITGGEPLLQQRRLVWLADMCRAVGRRVEIETNGTVPPVRALIQSTITFNVSVKLASSGVPEKRRIKPAAIEAFTRAGTARWKFVATCTTWPDDLEEITHLEKEFGLRPIWVMPEGTDATTVLAGMREVADEVLRRGWNLTPRLHTLLWGDERGR
jgi:7-carboxy-7-deazaguanine synthase